MARIVDVLTNEWYKAERVKPSCGREVLCFVMTDGGFEYMTLKWNGWYWIDGNSGYRTPKVKNSKVIAWYMFERYVDRDEI